MNPRSTITRQVNTHIDKLVDEEMSFNTKVEYNDFEASIETFLGQIKTVKEKVNKSVKLAQQKAAEM